MKYLQDEALAELTAALTDCPVSQSNSNSRTVYGRLEAYTMKRAGTDKKVALTLSNKFVEDREAEESQMQELLKMGRKRSVSTGEAPVSSKQLKTGRSRSRSNSLDLPPPSTFRKRAASTGTMPEPFSNRLLTDLILTLNHSFPDYDFSAATALDFVPCPLQTAVQRINERLAEVAVQKDAQNQCFLSDLWSAVDKVINLSQVTMVYSYQPEDLQFLTQTLTEPTSSILTGSLDTVDENYESKAATQEVLWSFNYFFVNKTAKRILLFTCIETMRGLLDVNDDDQNNESLTGAVLSETPSYPAMKRRESLMSESVRSATESSVDGSDLMSVQRRINEEEDDDFASFDLDPAEQVSGGIPIDSA